MTDTDKLLERMDRDLQELKTLVKEWGDRQTSNREEFIALKARIYTAVAIIGSIFGFLAGWVKSLFF